MEPTNIFDLDWSRVLEFYDLSKKCLVCGKETTNYRVVPTVTKVKVFGFCSEHATAMSNGFEADEGEITLLQVNLHHKLVMDHSGRKDQTFNRFGLSFAPPEVKPVEEGGELVDPKRVDPAILPKIPPPWEIDAKTLGDPELQSYGYANLEVLAWSKLEPADFYFDVDNTPDGLSVALAPRVYFDQHHCLYDQSPLLEYVCDQVRWPDYLYEEMEAMYEIDSNIAEAAYSHFAPNQPFTPQGAIQMIIHDLTQIGFIHNTALKTAGQGTPYTPPQTAPGPNSVLKVDGVFWVPDYSKIQPSDMLFARHTEEGVYMVAREYFEREHCVHDTDIDYNWVKQYVPSEMNQACESLFHFNCDWEPLRQKLLAAGFVEEPAILGEGPDGPTFIDFSTLKPSDMLFGVTLSGNSNYDPNTVIMCPKTWWEREQCQYEQEIDYTWVQQHVPQTLVQTAEAIFEIQGDWSSIKQQLLAAGFVEEPGLIY